jgi:hypothetical protein
MQRATAHASGKVTAGNLQSANYFHRRAFAVALVWIDLLRFSAEAANMRHRLLIDDRNRCVASLLCKDRVGTQFAVPHL